MYPRTDVLTSFGSSRFPVATGKLAPYAARPFSKKTHYVGLFSEFGYFGEKMTFFHDPDGLPIEIHEQEQQTVDDPLSSFKLGQMMSFSVARRREGLRCGIHQCYNKAVI